jgi:hypothetical protein
VWARRSIRCRVNATDRTRVLLRLNEVGCDEDVSNELALLKLS